MNNSQLYSKWQKWLTQLIPDQCESRVKNLTLLVVGLYLSQSIHLNHIARKLPIRAKKLSLVRRLSRFLDNAAVVVEDWYAPWAKSLIQSAASGGTLHLVVDTTKVTSSYRLLCIAVAYRRRSLPLLWSWVGHRKGHCTVQQQIALLKRLRRWIPEGIGVSLVGDGEFGNVLVLELLDSWQWDYVLRQAKNTKVLLDGADHWQCLDQLPIIRGQVQLFEKVLLTYASYPTTIVVIWRSTEPEPIFVATNQISCKATWRLYKKRMWIEEMFGDMKRHGFHLEHSRLKHPARLDRLMLIVGLVYLWLVAVGEHVLDHRLTDEIDRHDRQDLSIFRLGWDFLERRLALDDPIPNRFCPNFCFMSGS